MSNTFIEFLVGEAEERIANYIQYREYYEGEHRAQITDRQRAYLNLRAGQDFAANYMGIVVDSLANRLTVNGFDAKAEKELNEWWEVLAMPNKQIAVHTSTLRDGDGFAIVEWDDELDRPLVTPQLAYDGRDGVQIHYDGSTGKPRAATKRWWIEWGKDMGKMRRMNVYEPHQISRYYSTVESDYDWLPWSQDGEQAVIEWLDNSGKPLGIPVIHFTNRARGFTHGLSELAPGIPMQNALNKSVIDLLAATDASGFRIIWLVGDTVDETKMSPGVIIQSQKDKDEADLKVFPGEDLRPLIEVVDSFVQRIGQVTGTPLSYFQQSGQMASEGTHKAHEGILLAKARTVSSELGASWSEVGRMMLKLSNRFGNSSHDPKQVIKPIWADFDTRELTQKLMEKANVVVALTGAGAGIKQSAIVAGFSEKEAELLAEMDETNDPVRIAQRMAEVGLNPAGKPQEQNDDEANQESEK